MKTAFRTIGGMFIVLFASLVINGCATTPRAAKPDAQSDTAATAAAAKEEAKKIIVAKVNGAMLTMDQLVTMMNRLPQKGGDPNAMEEHKKLALDKLVLQELAYQQAKTQGLDIGADKIEMAIDNFKSNVGGEKEFPGYLKQHDITEAELRSQVERGLLIELVYAREVLDKVSIPEEQVRAEYEKVKHLYVQPEKASVLDVYILKNEGKASQKKAKELLSKIKADPNKDPWKLTLDGTFIIRNFEIPIDLEPELAKAAKKLKPQELSGVIKTPNGLHIIKLKDYSPQRQLTFDEVKSALEVKFKVSAQEKRTQEWEQELKKDAKIVLMSVAAEQQEQKKP